MADPFLLARRLQAAGGNQSLGANISGAAVLVVIMSSDIVSLARIDFYFTKLHSSPCEAANGIGLEAIIQIEMCRRGC